MEAYASCVQPDLHSQRQETCPHHHLHKRPRPTQVRPGREGPLFTARSEFAGTAIPLARATQSVQPAPPALPPAPSPTHLKVHRLHSEGEPRNQAKERDENPSPSSPPSPLFPSLPAGFLGRMSNTLAVKLCSTASVLDGWGHAVCCLFILEVTQ